ncbi:hypothetical protein NDI47_14015 [Microcoleus vaginatus GB1-A2]|uniref:hypothetical protein n=1 Tax=Microcoleus vaginatus TaxID=119532 RepID=UPI0016837B88|nr:hypothetical protein [Microcoleus sp. FACHB-61]
MKDFMRCGQASSRASPTGDRSLSATYHILEGAYKPESENRHLAPFSRLPSRVQTSAGLPGCRTIATTTSRPLEPIRRSTFMSLLKYFSNSIDIN